MKKFTLKKKHENIKYTHTYIIHTNENSVKFQGGGYTDYTFNFLYSR